MKTEPTLGVETNKKKPAQQSSKRRTSAEIQAMDMTVILRNKIIADNLEDYGPNARSHIPNQYVVVFGETISRRTVILYKTPKVSRLFPGKYNLPGRKLQPGEIPAKVAIESYKKITGVTAYFPLYIGEITDHKDYVVYVFNAKTEDAIDDNSPCETKIFTLENFKTTPEMVDDIAVLIGLCSVRARCFSVYKDGFTQGLIVNIFQSEVVARHENDKDWIASIHGSHKAKEKVER